VPAEKKEVSSLCNTIVADIMCLFCSWTWFYGIR